MAKKNNSNAFVTEVEINGKKVFALKDGESLITVADYRRVQEKNAKLTKELNDSNMAKAAAEEQKNIAENNLADTNKKIKRNKIITAIVAVALGVSLFFAGLGIGNNNHKDCVPREKYDEVVAELEDANDIIEKLNQKVNQFEEKISDLEEKNKVTEAELAKAKQQVEKLQSDLDKAFEEIARLEEKNVLLTEENAKLQEEIEAQQAQIEELQGKIDGYLDRIEDLEAQLAIKDQAGVNNNNSQNNNGNVSVGKNDDEDVNNNDSNIKQDESDYEPVN